MKVGGCASVRPVPSKAGADSCLLLMTKMQHQSHLAVQTSLILPYKHTNSTEFGFWAGR